MLDPRIATLVWMPTCAGMTYGSHLRMAVQGVEDLLLKHAWGISGAESRGLLKLPLEFLFQLPQSSESAEIS